MQSIEELEEMGLVEVESSAASDIVRLTTAGHEFAALRASVRAEGREEHD